MKILVSSCLLGYRCKYDGGDNYSKELEALLEGHEVVHVCPELEGGLPVPRIPCEISDGIVINKIGENKDAEFRLGAAVCLDLARREGIELAILQPRSPSCGAGRIYDGTFSGKLIPGNGVFADLLIRNGIEVISADQAAERLRQNSQVSCNHCTR